MKPLLYASFIALALATLIPVAQAGSKQELKSKKNPDSKKTAPPPSAIKISLTPIVFTILAIA